MPGRQEKVEGVAVYSDLPVAVIPLAGQVVYLQYQLERIELVGSRKVQRIKGGQRFLVGVVNEGPALVPAQ